MLKMVIDPNVLINACQNPLSDHRAFISETMDVFDAQASAAEKIIFLSYARSDQTEVYKIYKALSKDGFHPWIDIKEIRPGKEWRKVIKPAILRAHVFIAFLSKSANAKLEGVATDPDKVLLREHEIALEIHDDLSRKDFTIIPYKIEECEVPGPLKRFQWIEWNEKRKYQRLKNAVQETIGATIPFQICTDKEREIINKYESEVGGSELYRNWCKTLRKLFDDNWRGNTHHVNTSGLGCIDPIQQVCIEVADSSSSELIYEGGVAIACSSCHPHSACLGPSHLQSAGIPVFPAAVAREKLRRLRERLTAV